MDYQKQNINVFKKCAKRDGVQNYDWDIIVPDSKPDVATIISTDGVISIISKEIMQDRAIINGSVKINILYISSEDTKCVKSIENIQSFTYVSELDGLRQNMTFYLDSNMLKITSSVLNSRKINVACTIQFNGSAYSSSELSYIENVECKDVMQKTKEIKTLQLSSCFEKSIPFSDSVEVPVGKASVLEILKIKPEFSGKSLKCAKGKMILRGNLVFSTVYLSDTDEDFVQFMSHEIPVNEIIDWDGIEENSDFDYDIDLNNFNYILKDNSDGEKRIVKLNLDILIKGKVYKEIDICPIEDAYSLKSELELKKNDFEYDEILNDLSGQFMIKDTALFEDGGDIKRILVMDISSDVDRVENGNGFIKIKGKIFVNTLFLSMEDKVLLRKCTVPFEHTVISDGANENTLCDLKLEADSYSYNILSANSVEIRVNFIYKIRVKKCVLVSMVENMEVKADFKEKSHKITVFFCEGNESLWDIAKKYKTTVEDIKIVNELNNEEIIKGIKLLIP